MRHSRPDYIEPGAPYRPIPVDSLSTPIEFATEHRADRRRGRIMTVLFLALVAVVALLITATVALADDPDPMDPPRPSPSAEPTVYAPRPPAHPDDELVSLDIIWGASVD